MDSSKSYKRRMDGTQAFYKTLLCYRFMDGIIVFFIVVSIYYCTQNVLENTDKLCLDMKGNAGNYSSNQNCTSYSNSPNAASNVYHYAWIFFLLTLLSIPYIYRYFSQVTKKYVEEEAKLDAETVSKLSEKRINNAKLKTYASAEYTDTLSKDSPIILSGLIYENVMITPQPLTDIYYNLKTFMSFLSWEKIPGSLPPYIDIVLYIRDVLNGLQYLHNQQIYHLNLCPENIFIVRCSDNVSGIAKISGFDFARKSEECTVDYQHIGLERIYRPPEYFAEGSVDAAAVDYWGVGITAYEILTGGMITIYSETMSEFTNQSVYEMIEKEDLMELCFFSSAVEASWQYMKLVTAFDSIFKFGDTTYNVRPVGFLKDSWCFVNELMQLYPEKRSTILEALHSSFITKTTNPKLCRIGCNVRFGSCCCNRKCQVPPSYV